MQRDAPPSTNAMRTDPSTHLAVHLHFCVARHIVQPRQGRVNTSLPGTGRLVVRNGLRVRVGVVYLESGKEGMDAASRLPKHGGQRRLCGGGDQLL